MKEFLANTLESFFGEGGYAETTTKIALGVVVGYLGLRFIIAHVDLSGGQEPVPAITETVSSPTLTPTLNLRSVEEGLNQENCLAINPPEIPNAFKAWLKLGKPKEVIFFNTHGPDGDHNNSGRLIINKGKGIVANLPDLVHKGDRFCRP